MGRRRTLERAGAAIVAALLVTACGAPRPGGAGAVLGIVASFRPGNVRPAGATPSAEPPAVPHRVERAIPYGPAAGQRLDLYLPDLPPAARRPALVFLHSGGWIAGSRSNIPPFLLQLAMSLGMAVASVDYRLATPTGDAFPTGPSDVDRAIRFLKRDPRLDASKVVVAGTSAGGHLAALAGAAPGAFADPHLPPALAGEDPGVIGVIDIVGPSDLAAFAGAGGWASGMVVTFLGCHGACPPAAMRAASIAPRLTRAAPPAFLAYGAKDSLVTVRSQGRPLALAWAAARGELRKPEPERAVWYDESPQGGHNPSPATVNTTLLEAWLTRVLSGAWQ